MSNLWMRREVLIRGVTLGAALAGGSLLSNTKWVAAQPLLLGGSPKSVAFSKFSGHVYAALADPAVGLAVVEGSSGKLLGNIFRGMKIVHVSLNRQETNLVVVAEIAAQTDRVFLVDIATGNVIRQADISGGTTSTITFNRVTYAITGRGQKYLEAIHWDYSERRLQRDQWPTTYVLNAFLGPTTPYNNLFIPDDRGVRILDLTNGRLNRLNTLEYPGRAFVLPRGIDYEEQLKNIWLVGNIGGTSKTYRFDISDTSRGQWRAIQTLPAGLEASALSVDTFSRSIVVSDLGSRQLIVYNANNGVEKLRQPLPFGPTALSLNKAQRIAWLTGVGGELLGVSYP